MKSMKKYAAVALVGVLGASFMSIGTFAEEKTMTIGLIPQSTLFVFYDYVLKGATDAADEAGYTINYQGTTTDTDGTGQRKIVEDMLVTGVSPSLITFPSLSNS